MWGRELSLLCGYYNMDMTKLMKVKCKPPGRERRTGESGRVTAAGRAGPDSADFSEILPGPARLSRSRPGDSPGPELRGKCLKVFILKNREPAVKV